MNGDACLRNIRALSPLAWKRISALMLLVYMGIILGLTMIPDEESSGSVLGWVSPNLQNFLHLPAFGILALLWIWTLHCHEFSEARCILFSFIFSTAFGLLSEGGQVLVPGRYPSIIDFGLDLTGIMVVLWGVRSLKLFEWKKWLSNA